MHEIILTQSHDHVTADSLMIAVHFGKQHKHVIDAIENLIAQTSAEISANLFIESSYLDSYGRSQKNYQMTRDGFSLLVMGFTGREALEWKLKYIAAFNELEKAATKPMSHAEMLLAQANLIVDHEKRLMNVENKQEALLEALTAPSTSDWENDINGKVRMICKTRNLNYQGYWQELYIRLEATARVNLASRKANKIKRMKDAGCKSKEYNAVSKLNVVAEDRHLKNIFESIIREEVAKLALVDLWGDPA